MEIKMNQNLNTELFDFIRNSPSVFHVIRNISKKLTEAGFIRLDEQTPWEIRPGKGYYTTRGGSSVIAFRIPGTDSADNAGFPAVRSFHIAASHSDSPTFKIKPDPEIESAGLVKLNIEKYGGMLTSTWYDRPLTVAGRVLFRSDQGITEHLVHIDRDLLLIPSLAIHMDRDANAKGFGNVQNDMQPVFTDKEHTGSFMEMISSECGCSPEDILGTDLFLVNRTLPSVWGAHEEFISAPKLDDLMCAFGTLAGFLHAEMPKDFIQMCCVFDNEEVGSSTRQGADSTFLTECIERIAECLGVGRNQLSSAIASGMMISADNAHAAHPNHTDKADPVLRPRMNQGIVLKYHANQKYTTDAVSEALFTEICRRHDIPYQKFVNRSDMNGGSTLGNISNTHVSIRTADIGLPQLAMHSAYETAGTEDLAALVRLSERFFSEALPEIQVK